jgi:hypothetical protein
MRPRASHCSASTWMRGSRMDTRPIVQRDCSDHRVELALMLANEGLHANRYFEVNCAK